MSIPYVKAGKYVPEMGDLIWKREGSIYLVCSGFGLAEALPFFFFFFTQTTAGVVRLPGACLGLLGCGQTIGRETVSGS